MRYLSLIFILIALICTWNIGANSSHIQKLQTHVSIQDDLGNIIAEAVATHLPNAKNLKFQRLWTKNISSNEIQANFAYTFENTEGEEVFNVALEGSATMKQIFESAPGADPEKPNTTPNDKPTNNWLLESVRLNNETIHFDEGIVVTPSGKSEEKSESKKQ